MLHGDEFETVYKENTMIGEIDYLKVLDYSDTSARVYYVGVDKAGGDEVIFFKRGGGWFVEKWYTIWSGRGGSASNVIWPQWWHFIYGGF